MNPGRMECEIRPNTLILTLSYIVMLIHFDTRINTSVHVQLH